MSENKSLDEAKNFVSQLTKSPLSEIGEIFADNIKVWRLKNQIKNLEKVKKIVKDSDMKLKDVNLKVLLPYLEHVSLEEDETLQNLWANLLANYIDAEKNLTLTVYPFILSQLSTEEVKILNKGILQGNIKCSEDINQEALYNLVRLGIFNENIKINRYGEGAADYEEIGSDSFYMTEFGSHFYSAIHRK